MLNSRYQVCFCNGIVTELRGKAKHGSTGLSQRQKTQARRGGKFLKATSPKDWGWVYLRIRALDVIGYIGRMEYADWIQRKGGGLPSEHEHSGIMGHKLIKWLSRRDQVRGSWSVLSQRLLPFTLGRFCSTARILSALLQSQLVLLVVGQFMRNRLIYQSGYPVSLGWNSQAFVNLMYQFQKGAAILPPNSRFEPRLTLGARFPIIRNES